MFIALGQSKKIIFLKNFIAGSHYLLFYISMILPLELRSQIEEIHKRAGYLWRYL